MGRPRREALGGMCYHVINRGNGRAQVFNKALDYAAFLKTVEEIHERLPMRVLAYCLMPNHFHFVLWPHNDGDLSVWMHRVTSASVKRYHMHFKSSGHVWQGRYRSFPMQDDQHLMRVLRYVERNPLRARLAERAEEWDWSSLPWWDRQPRPPYLAEGPLPRPKDWLELVNAPQSQEELDAIRACIGRGRPYGTPHWSARTAQDLGLQSTLRGRGRPHIR